MGRFPRMVPRAGFSSATIFHQFQLREAEFPHCWINGGFDIEVVRSNMIRYPSPVLDGIPIGPGAGRGSMRVWWPHEAGSNGIAGGHHAKQRTACFDRVVSFGPEHSRGSNGNGTVDFSDGSIRGGEIELVTVRSKAWLARCDAVTRWVAQRETCWSDE